jgi:MarR family transcriptional regulator, organic hydroperoxide resistance regulator
MPHPLVRVERSQPAGETLRFMQQMWDLVHALDVRSKRMARTLGVTGPQRLVVRVLGQSPGMTASGIADTLGMHPSTLTGILSRLVARGMLARKVDTADRRRSRFNLTAGGRAIDRERKGTVEAAVRRALVRADASTIGKTSLMLALLTEEISRPE